jgi:hypothetical protein
MPRIPICRLLRRVRLHRVSVFSMVDFFSNQAHCLIFNANFFYFFFFFYLSFSLYFFNFLNSESIMFLFKSEICSNFIFYFEFVQIVEFFRLKNSKFEFSLNLNILQTCSNLFFCIKLVQILNLFRFNFIQMCIVYKFCSYFKLV